MEYQFNAGLKGDISMPVHKTPGGGYQWGKSGKIYYGKGAKAKAEKQGRAAYANGYKEK